jgi:hypothetical protein
MRVYIVFDNDAPMEAYLDEAKAKRVVDAQHREQRKRAKEVFPRMEPHHYWHIHEVWLKDWMDVDYQELELRAAAAAGVKP